MVKDSVIGFIEITGTVEDLGPVHNAFVYEKGKPNSARTDKDGRFAIKIPLEHFENPVCLRFEIWGTLPVEKVVTATTKSIKVRLNEPRKKAKTKWVVTSEMQKPDVSEIIINSLETFLKIAKNIKREKKDDDAPAYREVNSRSPRF